ncbi:hypothetical protein [Exiguobacterium sp. s133]|uniref:hypothetical protein n=1 Tax=Exiguobacterium sp. s133 TaxID=2751213 RepID=UPI001BEB2EFC|nr:hypothetical protein [Exiguobacterium sp. s133]
MSVEKYRKKPVVIEAVKLEDEYKSIVESIEFVYSIGMETSEWGMNSTVRSVKEDGGFSIETLEGNMFAKFGDYIIKGVQGEFYPCKPDIFEATYEKAAE